MTESSKPRVVHLNSAAPLSAEQAALREMELSIAGHFQQQNTLLIKHNDELRGQLSRLTNGVERLVAEMHGVRTGEKAESFARIAPVGASPDLPTVSAEAALLYTETSTSIGSELGFAACQIGQLLGPTGLRWAGNPDYQELGRKCGPSASKFWHREVASRLRTILNENDPGKYGIRAPAVKAMFRKWSERQPSLPLAKAND